MDIRRRKVVVSHLPAVGVIRFFASFIGLGMRATLTGDAKPQAPPGTITPSIELGCD
jgi:hypothetical protein